MNIQKLNEELEKFIINEISDDTKASYLAKVQADFDKAQARLNKAKGAINKSNQRQIAGFSKAVDKETATKALNALKREMKKIDSGTDWRSGEEDNIASLEVRYWGQWEGDDGSGDYDWQTLTSEYQNILNNILTKVQKEYKVQIQESGAEKNWLVFEIEVAEASNDKYFEDLLERTYKIFKKITDNSNALRNFNFEWEWEPGSASWMFADWSRSELHELYAFIDDRLNADGIEVGCRKDSYKPVYIILPNNPTDKEIENICKKAYDELVKNVEQLYVDRARQKLRDFDELKDKYVNKITHILEADGWNLVESEEVYGFDTEYTYEKYIESLEENVYCVFTQSDFYGIFFSVGSPKNEDWEEAQLSNFIELPSHPVLPEKMDYIQLDPRYDGSTAKDAWNQYVKFVKNTLAALENPKLLK